MTRLIGVVVAVVLAGGAAAAWLTGSDDAPITEPVALAGDSPFRYPIALWDRGAEGETVLMVHVTAVGAVDTAYVLLSSGQAAFDSAALAGSRELRFAPARRGDERIDRWARLPVRFRMPADSAHRKDG